MAIVPRPSVPETRPAIIGIDFLRLLASLMVVLFHLGFWQFLSSDDYLLEILGSADIGRTLMPLSHWGWVGVEIFFVISGFVIATTAEHSSTVSFIRSRLVRLAPGIWICAPISLVAVLFLGRSDLSPAPFQQFLNTLVLNPRGQFIDNVYWTLPVEVCFYSIVFALVSFHRFDRVPFVMIVIGCYSTGFWVLYNYASLWDAGLAQWLVPLSTTLKLVLSQVRYGCFFALGVLLWLQLRKHTSPTLLLLSLFFTFGCVSEIISTNSRMAAWSNTETSPWIPVIIWLLAVAGIIFSVLYNDRLRNRFKGIEIWARRCGLLTYPLYLLHFSTGPVFMQIFSWLGLSNWLAWMAGIFLVIFLASVVSSIFEPRLQDIVKKLYDKATRYCTQRSLRRDLVAQKRR